MENRLGLPPQSLNFPDTLLRRTRTVLRAFFKNRQRSDGRETLRIDPRNRWPPHSSPLLMPKKSSEVSALFPFRRKRFSLWSVSTSRNVISCSFPWCCIEYFSRDFLKKWFCRGYDMFCTKSVVFSPFLRQHSAFGLSWPRRANSCEAIDIELLDLHFRIHGLGMRSRIRWSGAYQARKRCGDVTTISRGLRFHQPPNNSRCCSK